MNKTLITALTLGAALPQLHAASILPLGATGWNADIVLGAGDPATVANTPIVGGRTQTMDQGTNNGGATWYGQGYNSTAPGTGLPTGVTTSLNTPALSILLQPFVGANNDVMDGGTLLLTGTPSANVRLALVGSTGNGTGNVTITVNFADASPSEVFASLGGAGTINSDWFFQTPVAINAQGRVNVDNGNFDNVNNNQPRLYESIFTLANKTSKVSSVTITDGGNGFNAVMAISGEAVPEPSALALVGMTVLGFASRRRRL